ncbi:glycine cleavage system protein H [Chloroflexota bacterium]
MFKNEPGGKGEKREYEKPRQVTRRRFLKEASTVVGGATIVSLSFIPACGPTDNTATSGTTTTTTTPTTTATTTPSTTTNTNANTTTTTFATSTNTWSGIYTPSTKGMELLPIPGCTTFVASDRMYMIEHVWVKSITDDKVVIGITDKLQELMDFLSDLRVLEEGETVIRDETFGSGVGSKMAVEFLSPVSGVVLQVNSLLWNELHNPGNHILNLDPYVKGWMLVIQLNKPEELNDLLTPEEYINLNAKVIK